MNFYVGQIFGNREIVALNCKKEDWESIGLKTPRSISRYVLTRCLNCNTIIPADQSNLRQCPPNRCVFCSNIGNFSGVNTQMNTWIIKDDMAICNVLFHKHVVSFFIDAIEYEKVSKYTWRISQKRQKYYVITGSAKKGTMKYLHQMIFSQDTNGLEIDHIDGNSLNNMRINLRLVTRQENIDNQRATRIDNSIGIRGISFDKRSKKYTVDFNFHNHRYYVKPWDTIEEAVWCRKCFEDYFNIPAIRSNPIAKNYFILPEYRQHEIQQYVLDKILGNER